MKQTFGWGLLRRLLSLLVTLAMVAGLVPAQGLVEVLAQGADSPGIVVVEPEDGPVGEAGEDSGESGGIEVEPADGDEDPALQAQADAVPYLDWDEGQKKLVQKVADNCTVVSDTTAAWGRDSEETWYVVDKNVTVSGRVEVKGKAHLILCDDATLTAKQGVTTTGAELVVHGQSGGDAAGRLVAGAGNDAAGIGGTSKGAGGSLTVNGGSVTATGGYGAAGIGGGRSGAGGTVAVNGGTVTATGGSYYGAGIGGGDHGGGGALTVNGGTVTATGGGGAAGIGGGYEGDGGPVTVNGGSVTAMGGPYGAGIGGGRADGAGGAGGTVTVNGGSVTATGSSGGAGIGGGYEGAGGAVAVNGGAVTATGGYGAAGIGGGVGGDGGTVAVNGGAVTATGGKYAVGIGGGDGASSHGDLSVAASHAAYSAPAKIADRSADGVRTVRGTGSAVGIERLRYMLVEPSAQDAPVLVSHSLTLSGTIGVNYLMDLSMLDEETRAGSWMEFTIGTAEAKKVTSRAGFDSQNRSRDGKSYGFTCPATSIQMADPIAATFHYGNRSLALPAYSVEEYIRGFDAYLDAHPGAFDDKTVGVVHATADYGHHAQPFLAQENGWTVGADYAAMGTFYTDSYADRLDAIKEGLAGHATRKALEGTGVVSVSLRLHLGSGTAVEALLGPAEGQAFTQGDVAAVTATFVTGKEPKVALLADGRISVRVDNVSAHQLGAELAVRWNGEEAVSLSALSYAHGVLSDGSANEKREAAMCALYTYFERAAAATVRQ